ncbi:Vacuolar protein sorting-associated protein 41, partial [Kappamyces sp. JEL0680]
MAWEMWCSRLWACTRWRYRDSALTRLESIWGPVQGALAALISGIGLGSNHSDGTVVIQSLYSASDKTIHNLKRPLSCLALEPDYGKKRYAGSAQPSSSKQFVSGGNAGELSLIGKGIGARLIATGWFGSATTILFAGEGLISATSWNGTFIAFCTEKGTHVYDTTSSSRLGFIERIDSMPRGDLFRPSIHWQSPTDLLVGWGDSVRVLGIRARSAMDVASGLGQKQILVLHQFKTEFLVLGLGPLDETIVLLGLAVDFSDFDQVDNLNRSTGAVQSTGEPPEIHVVNMQGIELANDVLSMPGHRDFTPRQYQLSSGGTGDGSDASFYIVSPRDVIMAKPRDVRDHVAWLMESGLFLQAYQLVEANERHYSTSQKAGELLEIGQRYIQTLLDSQDYAEAGEWCAKVLRQNARLWEQWILKFTDVHHGRDVVWHIPTASPKLSHTYYELVLNEYLVQQDLPGFWSVLQKWPPELYVVKNVIASVLHLGRDDDSDVMQILRFLYAQDRQWDRSVYYGLLLGEPDEGARIEEHNLWGFLHDHVLLLLEYAYRQAASDDSSRADICRSAAASKVVSILVSSTDYAPVPHCLKVLESSDVYLFVYLDALFTRDPGETLPYQDLLVALYAEYDPSRLLDFLRTATAYSYPHAYDICESRDLLREMMFLLGKMGDKSKALQLIITRMNNVERAIEFAKEQNDDALWSEFLKYAMDKPAFIVGLLQHSGGHLDPVRVIEKIPLGLDIPDLKASIIQIMHDCSVQLSLRQGCEKILQSDIWGTFAELTQRQKRGHRLHPDSVCNYCDEPITNPSDHLIVFFCHHIFHADCIQAKVTASLPHNDSYEQEKKMLHQMDGAIDSIYGRGQGIL